MNLENAYEREELIEFLTNFLPDFCRDIRSVDVAGCKAVKEGYTLGRSEKCDLQVFELTHAGSHEKRVRLTNDGFRIMKDTASYQALAAYRSVDSETWRLSLITATPELGKGGKVVTKLSNPRRFSFALGPNAKVVTPHRYLIQKGRVSDLEDLKSRFSIEIVNNEFYRGIAKLYDDLVGTETIKGVLKYPVQGEIVNEFAVRLIGRIIFCWFLREKRSTKDTPLMPRTLLSREGADTDNYYHGVLEPLFFEVLNKKLDTRSEPHRTLDYDSVPYLNGGLFNPDTDDYYVGESSKAREHQIDVPDAWLRKFFDLLELYSFTVDENTSRDVDLSIDPEMLGRIFENLLARINPETGEMVRKATGSFYTPREIVEHMVDQGLNEYLSKTTNVDSEKLSALISYDLTDDIRRPLTDSEKRSVIDSLGAVKILDPACGSGAFPIGMLQKVVFILQQADPDASLWLDKQLSNAGPEFRRHLEKEFQNKNFDYLRKLGVIRESIYGVDIQPIATEISRLRCFLTLVVDQSVDDAEVNRGIEPLPNLDFKFVTANSLLDLRTEAPSANQSGLFEDREGIDELKRLRNQYFSSHNAERESLKLKFSQRQNTMLQEMIGNHRHGFSELTRKLSTWNPFSHKATAWFDSEWMFGISSGFDIVIGNPPYGLLNKKQNQKMGHTVTKEEIEHYKSSPKYQPASGGMINVFRLFIVQSINLLKENGAFVQIFPLAFIADVSAANLRRHIFNHFQIIGIDAFPERDDEKRRVFESAKMSVCILYLDKRPPQETAGFFIRINNDRYVEKNGPTVHITTDVIESIDSKNVTIPLLGQEDLDLIQRIYNKSEPLSKYGHCFTGEVDLTLGRKYLTANSQNAPFIKGAIIDRYLIREKMSQGEIEYINKDLYLRENTAKKSFHHKQERIAMQAISGVNEEIRLKCTIINPGIFCGNSVNYVVLEDTKIDIRFLLGLLNSRLINYVFKKFSTNSNVNGYEVDNLPIAKNLQAQQPIIDLVTEILVQKTRDSGKDSTKLEMEVDQLVYDLYGLTPSEIKVLEGHTGAAKEKVAT